MRYSKYIQDAYRFSRILVLLVFLLMARGRAQTPVSVLGLWNIKKASGSLALEGRYSQQESRFINGRQNSYLSKLLFGEMMVNMKTNIWHPNFLLLDLEGEYRPGIRSDEFLITPFRTETNTLSRFYSKATFFSGKPLSFGLFFNYSESQIDREFATSVNIKKTTSGGNFAWKNNFMPLRFEYQKEDWTQKELAIDRILTNKSRRIQSIVSKSFSNRDYGQFKVSYQDYRRQYTETVFAENKVLDASLDENIKLDKKGKSTFISRAWYLKQTGDDNFERLLINENMNYRLPWNFTFQGSYDYNEWKQSLLNSKQHNARLRMMHQLYLSLSSNVRAEYVDVDHTDYSQIIKEWGGGVRYQKKIPTGKITFSYDYNMRRDDRRRKSGQLRIKNEEHALDDNAVILLDNANVLVGSVVVWNADRTLQYQENIDYILIPRGVFVEIKRLTGGQIEPGGTVVVDYFVEQTPVERFDNIRNAYSAGITLFDGFLEAYGRWVDQDFDNVEITDSQLLKVISQRTLGARISYGFLTTGYEKDEFNSNIIPYDSEKYFLTLSGVLNNKFSFSLNGTLRELKLVQDAEKQSFRDLSARLSYFFTRNIKLNINGGYRQQRGRQIDLDLLSLRAELVSRFRQVFISAGAEAFSRDFIGEKVDYGNFFLRLERRF